MKTKDNKTLWLGLGLALGGTAGALLASRRAGVPRRIPQLADWEGALARSFGKQKAALLAAKVQARYEALYPGRPRFRNAALRGHLEGQILPGLALYRVLQEELGDQQAALETVDRCFSAYAQASRMAQEVKLLDRVPGEFAILRAANRAILRARFPEEGWQIDWEEDSPRRIAFDITGCFYLNVLKEYGAPELTARFCALDDLVYGRLAGVSFDRTQTLGRGDPYCDFQFRPRERVAFGEGAFDFTPEDA